MMFWTGIKRDRRPGQRRRKRRVQILPPKHCPNVRTMHMLWSAPRVLFQFPRLKKPPLPSSLPQDMTMRHSVCHHQLTSLSIVVLAAIFPLTNQSSSISRLLCLSLSVLLMDITRKIKNQIGELSSVHPGVVRGHINKFSMHWEGYRVQQRGRTRMYCAQGILERCINIDWCQSNSWLSSIKGPKCQRRGPVHQKRLATPFPGDVLFLVKSHARHHGINWLVALFCDVLSTVHCVQDNKFPRPSISP